MEFSPNHFQSFSENFTEINQGPVIFKPFETNAGEQWEISFLDSNIQQLCHNMTSNNVTPFTLN